MSITTKIGNIQLTIPTEVSEITLGQFLDLRRQKEDDPIGALSILSGKGPQLFKSLRYTAKTERQLHDVFKLTMILVGDINRFNASPEKVMPPDKVTVLGKEIRVPKDLEEEPFWPTRVVKDLMTRKGKDQEYDPAGDYDTIIAHYLYVPFTELQYNERRADEFKAAIRDLPFDQAVRLGNFFLTRSSKHWLPRRKSWLLRIRIKKFSLAYRILKFLGTSTR